MFIFQAYYSFGAPRSLCLAKNDKTRAADESYALEMKIVILRLQEFKKEEKLHTILRYKAYFEVLIMLIQSVS